MDDVTDRVGLTVRRVEAFSSDTKTPQIYAESLQLGNAPVDISGPIINQSADVLARSFTALTQRHDPTNLTQREPARLCGADEREPTDRVVPIAPIAVRAAFRTRKQTNALVITDGLRRHP